MPQIALIAPLLCLLAASPWTQAPKTEDKKTEDGKKQKDSKKKKESKEDSKEQKPKEEKPKKKHPYFEVADQPAINFGKGTHLDFRARFAADESDSEAADLNDAEVTTFDLGKKRLGVSGEIRNIFEFQVERELDDFDPWRDVYGEFKYFDFARVRG